MVAGQQLHFRCTFDLDANESDDQWGRIVKRIRQWIIDRRIPQSESLPPRQFYTGIDWDSLDKKRLSVRTEQIIGAGTTTSPEFWALRLEHPCDQLPHRTWGIDIGLTRICMGSWRCVITVTHWIKQGWIGEEKPPDASAPSIVANLIGSKFWNAYNGDEQLSPFPIELKVGMGKDFAERIKNGRRFCPIVLVTNDFVSGKARIDPKLLARLLCGSASVYQTVGPDIDKELEYFLPYRFRCWNGMVRVYQPSVRFDDERDAERHRFFYGTSIDEQGVDRVIQQLVNGIARRGPDWVGNVVSSIEDITDRKRIYRIRQLKMDIINKGNNATYTEMRQWTDLLENDNEALNLQLCEARSKLEQIESEYQNREDKAQYYIEQLRNESEQLRVRNAELEQSRAALLSLNTLPKSLAQVVEKIAKLHADKIIFTEQALGSAEDCGFTDIEQAWRCLFAMASNLWHIYFGDKPIGNIENEFRNQTGFELNLSEGKRTRDDKKLMALRKQMWKGQQIDIEPHVKIGNKPPKMLRVHYFADKEHKLIIVGYCGHHLVNYSTKKRR